VVSFEGRKERAPAGFDYQEAGIAKEGGTPLEIRDPPSGR
jgi:hypothetical protein